MRRQLRCTDIEPYFLLSSDQEAKNRLTEKSKNKAMEKIEAEKEKLKEKAAGKLKGLLDKL